MIGRRKTSKCTVCTNTSCLIPITFTPANQYATRAICVTPFLGRMIPNGDMMIQPNFVGNPSAYHDFGFRRILTMFTQLRCKGVYLKVTPMIHAANMDFVTVWSCWERKAKNPDWNMYGLLDNQETARRIREAAELQGKKGAIMNISKGFFSYSTKCTPLGIEKTGWLDAATQVTEQQGTTKNFHTFELLRTFHQDGNQTFVEFNPMCFIVFEAPVSVTVNTTVLMRIDMRCFIQLRYPGCTQNDVSLLNLLRPNASLIPWVPTKEEEERKKKEEEEKKDGDDDDDDDQIPDEKTMMS